MIECVWSTFTVFSIHILRSFRTLMEHNMANYRQDIGIITVQMNSSISVARA